MIKNPPPMMNEEVNTYPRRVFNANLHLQQVEISIIKVILEA